MPIISQEIQNLMDLVEPYLDGIRLKPDAPANIVEADRKIDAWFHDVMDGVQ